MKNNKSGKKRPMSVIMLGLNLLGEILTRKFHQCSKILTSMKVRPLV
jgi:hypothetical protein